MRWLVLSVGGLATAAMIGISMRVNFLFGYSLGQTPERAEVFGWVSVISDLWKALGPIVIVALWPAKRQWATTAVVAIWAACLCYSVTSAVGAAIEERSSRTGNRDTLVLNYDEFTADIKRLEDKRNGLATHRSAAIVEAAINAILVRPIEIYRRSSSTVGEVSANCQRADSRTTEACAEVAQLREELAAAKEEAELNREIATLKAQARDLRARGAIRSSDPQAELLAGITGGWLSPGDVGRVLALLLAMTIEFVSAFGPIVLSSYFEATERRDATKGDRPLPQTPIQQPAQTPGLVIDYFAERIEPAANTDTVSERALYADYTTWCRAADRAAVSAAEFVAEVDKLRTDNGLGNVIRKRRNGYAGIRLSVSS